MIVEAIHGVKVSSQFRFFSYLTCHDTKSIFEEVKKQLVRRYKFEIYPSPIQERYLAKIFGSCRFVYNECLKINNDLFVDQENNAEKKMSRSEMQELLTIWRDGLEWLESCPSQSLQVAVHDLDVAYQNFFDGRSERPAFKRRDGRQSFQLPQPKFKVVGGQSCVFIPNYKTHIPIRMHREFPKDSKIGAATITKTPVGRYFISIVAKFESNEGFESKSKSMVGIDLNIKSIVLSTGEKIDTPQIIKTLEGRKRRLQKSMQRKRDMATKDKRDFRKSKNYEKNRIALAKVHEKIKVQKEDFLHKLALKIYRENQSVAMETLNVKGMMKNRRLAKSIAFQSWGRFVEIMKMYAIQCDKNLHFISTWFPSSKMCHDCGFVNQELTLSHREWKCESCGENHDRDINAAINIKNEGGSYPVHKPVERKGSVRRPMGKSTTMVSEKQESSKFEAAS